MEGEKRLKKEGRKECAKEGMYDGNLKGRMIT